MYTHQRRCWVKKNVRILVAAHTQFLHFASPGIFVHHSTFSRPNDDSQLHVMGTIYQDSWNSSYRWLRCVSKSRYHNLGFIPSQNEKWLKNVFLSEKVIILEYDDNDNTMICKLGSMQNTGTCYTGQGWFIRSLSALAQMNQTNPAKSWVVCPFILHIS